MFDEPKPTRIFRSVTEIQADIDFLEHNIEMTTSEEEAERYDEKITELTNEQAISLGSNWTAQRIGMSDDWRWTVWDIHGRPCEGGIGRSREQAYEYAASAKANYIARTFAPTTKQNPETPFMDKEMEQLYQWALLKRYVKSREDFPEWFARSMRGRDWTGRSRFKQNSQVPRRPEVIRDELEYLQGLGYEDVGNQDDMEVIEMSIDERKQELRRSISYWSRPSLPYQIAMPSEVPEVTQIQELPQIQRYPMVHIRTTKYKNIDLTLCGKRIHPKTIITDDPNEITCGICKRSIHKEMTLCPNCGNPMTKGAIKCRSCGISERVLGSVEGARVKFEAVKKEFDPIKYKEKQAKQLALKKKMQEANAALLDGWINKEEHDNIVDKMVKDYVDSGIPPSMSGVELNPSPTPQFRNWLIDKGVRNYRNLGGLLLLSMANVYSRETNLPAFGGR